MLSVLENLADKFQFDVVHIKFGSNLIVHNHNELGITDVLLFVQFLIILKLAEHHFHKHELNRPSA